MNPNTPNGTTKEGRNEPHATTSGQQGRWSPQAAPTTVSVANPKPAMGAGIKRKEREEETAATLAAIEPTVRIGWRRLSFSNTISQDPSDVHVPDIVAGRYSDLSRATQLRMVQAMLTADTSMIRRYYEEVVIRIEQLRGDDLVAACRLRNKIDNAWTFFVSQHMMMTNTTMEFLHRSDCSCQPCKARTVRLQEHGKNVTAAAGSLIRRLSKLQRFIDISRSQQAIGMLGAGASKGDGPTCVKLVGGALAVMIGLTCFVIGLISFFVAMTLRGVTTMISIFSFMVGMSPGGEVATLVVVCGIFAVLANPRYTTVVSCAMAATIIVWYYDYVLKTGSFDRSRAMGGADPGWWKWLLFTCTVVPIWQFLAGYAYGYMLADYINAQFDPATRRFPMLGPVGLTMANSINELVMLFVNTLAFRYVRLSCAGAFWFVATTLLYGYIGLYHVVWTYSRETAMGGADPGPCSNCGKDHSPDDDCSRPKRVEDRRCRNCGEVGHLQRDCPTGRGPGGRHGTRDRARNHKQAESYERDLDKAKAERDATADLAKQLREEVTRLNAKKAMTELPDEKELCHDGDTLDSNLAMESFQNYSKSRKRQIEMGEMEDAARFVVWFAAQFSTTLSVMIAGLVNETTLRYRAFIACLRMFMLAYNWYYERNMEATFVTYEPKFTEHASPQRDLRGPLNRQQKMWYKDPLLTEFTISEEVIRTKYPWLSPIPMPKREVTISLRLAYLLLQSCVTLARDDPVYVQKKMRNLVDSQGFINLPADLCVDKNVVDGTVQFALVRLYGYKIDSDDEIMPGCRFDPGNVVAPARY